MTTHEWASQQVLTLRVPLAPLCHSGTACEDGLSCCSGTCKVRASLRVAAAPIQHTPATWAGAHAHVRHCCNLALELISGRLCLCTAARAVSDACVGASRRCQHPMSQRPTTLGLPSNSACRTSRVMFRTAAPAGRRARRAISAWTASAP